MRYRLRSLLILLAVGPPLLAYGWGKYEAWRAEFAREEELDLVVATILPVSGRASIHESGIPLIPSDADWDAVDHLNTFGATPE